MKNRDHDFRNDVMKNRVHDLGYARCAHVHVCVWNEVKWGEVRWGFSLGDLPPSEQPPDRGHPDHPDHPDLGVRMSRSPRFDDRDVVEIAKFWVDLKNALFPKNVKNGFFGKNSILGV